MWLEAVEAVLARVDVQVLGKASTSAQALAMLSQHRPALFVTDVRGDESGDGVDCLRRAQEHAPGVRCLALATSRDPEVIESAIAAGAVAYVLKSAHPDDLASAVRQVFDHSVYLARYPATTPAAPVLQPAESAVPLTNREREILRLVAEGHSNAQLARMLWVTEQTVKFHLSNVYRKLEVSNRTEAARWAQIHGLLPAHSELTAA